MSSFKLLGICACGAPCSRVGGRCKKCYTGGPPKRKSPTKARKVYTAAQKQEALRVVRERGAKAASRRFGIPVATLDDWKYATQAMAYSTVVRPDTPTEREVLLDQLKHEQEIEMRVERRKYRHNRERAGSISLDEELEPRPGSSLTRHEWVALEGGSVVRIAQRHLVEWLDPVFEEVAEEVAA